MWGDDSSDSSWEKQIRKQMKASNDEVEHATITHVLNMQQILYGELVNGPVRPPQQDH